MAINGTPGDDSLPGTPNADQINGLAGNDTLAGSAATPGWARIIGAIAVASCIGFSASTAVAELLRGEVNENSQTVRPATAPLDLSRIIPSRNDLIVTLDRQSWVEITFSAECLVRGQGGLTINIEVNPPGPTGFVEIPPTVGADDVFCSLDRRNTHSRTVFQLLDPGQTTVRVSARSAPVDGEIDDLVILVKR